MHALRHQRLVLTAVLVIEELAVPLQSDGITGHQLERYAAATRNTLRCVSSASKDDIFTLDAMTHGQYGPNARSRR